MSTALQEKQIYNLVRKQIIEVLQEFLNDPDFGSQLTEYARKKIKRSMASKKRIPLDDILRKYKI